MNTDRRDLDAHCDPLGGAPGAQPADTGVGVIVAGAAARGEASAGRESSSGAVAGAPAGKGGAGAIDPDRERSYWSEHFGRRDYVDVGSSFDDYGPAYALGVDARGRFPGREFDDVEAEMACSWAARRGASGLRWDQARHAARDAWNRIGPSR